MHILIDKGHSICKWCFSEICCAFNLNYFSLITGKDRTVDFPASPKMVLRA